MSDKRSKPIRVPLTNDMRLAITRELQTSMLTEISRRAVMAGVDRTVVFHGGTSLSLIHGTDRSSEDLDFMATPDAVRAIFSPVRQMEAIMQLRASLLWPGATVTLVDKTERQDPSFGDVDRLMLRWEHPERIGAIKVKVEFYVCPEARLGRYLARPQLIAGDESRGSIMAAVPVSIWADKIVAMAQRPALKHRDIHDLGVLAEMVDPEARHETALSASMGIYDRVPEEIRQGLARDLVLAGDHDFEGFAEDMGRWFGESHMEELRAAGKLSRIFEAYLEQARIGRDLVGRMAGQVPEPDDATCQL